MGSFDKAMENLEKFNLLQPLTQKALVEKIPFLGICLGMQILTNSSEEGIRDGLGWIKGHAKKFIAKDDIKVPHMGWNYINNYKQSKLCKGFDNKPRFYFVHSYYVQVEDD